MLLTMQILLIGDIHGNSFALKRVQLLCKTFPVDAVIFLGDTLWYLDKPFMKRISQLYNQTNEVIPTYIVGGNHENYDRIEQDGLTIYGSTPTVTPWGAHVKWLPRGSMFTFDGVKFCAIGGGISIDKGFRKVHESWWEQESIDEKKLNTVLKNNKADVLLCHDSPNYPELTSYILGTQNQIEYTFGKNVRSKSLNHQNILDRAANKLCPSVVLHGHYHVSLRQPSLQTTWGKCSFIGLSNIDSDKNNDAVPPGSWWIYDTQTFKASKKQAS